MEAEAQCAFMEQSNLVDGIVTDDSDVFLFGARSVYKNIFDDRKYVETYFMKVCISFLTLCFPTCGFKYLISFYFGCDDHISFHHTIYGLSSVITS